MNIIVNTKFNIGDKVYIANYYHDFYVTEKPHIIKDVLVVINSNKTMIRYEVEQNGSTDCVPEYWVFPSYEECAEWCESQNADF